MRRVLTRLQTRLHDIRPISDEWAGAAVVLGISCFVCICVWMALTRAAVILEGQYTKYTDTGEISYYTPGRDEEGIPRMVFVDVTDDPRAQEACRKEPPPYYLLFLDTFSSERVARCYVVDR
jgi:hypothetical protein